MDEDEHQSGQWDDTQAAAGAEPTPSQVELMAQIREVLAQAGRLPAERKLAEQLGVKRHQLRIALGFLRDTGDAPQPRPRNPRKPRRAGAKDIVRNTNPIEVIELRMMIEPTLARLAALRATPNMILEMKKIADQIDKGGKDRAGDLHRLIAQASGNALAHELYDMLRQIEGEVRMSAASGHNLRPNSDTDEHRAIIAAIAGRDPDTAERGMRRHLASIHQLMIGAGLTR
ncbi:FCD domain-containing protein [Thioclava sp. GXIMD2076]|uniref:FadR/GntR family transcriptional regulator n=1 Tax=Thioclava sp. GXIMD2076 TaxID=3131931 RepID=UPI0030D0AFB8